MLEQLRRISGNFSAEDVLLYEDDFVGGINTLVWSIVSTLTGSQSGVNAAGGLRRLSTGLTGLADTKISLPVNTFIVRPDRNPILEQRSRLAPTGTLTNMFFEWGFGDNNNGAVFQFDQTANANWRVLTRNGGTATTTTTSLVAAVNTFLKFRMMVTASSVQFLVNDAVVATHTTNLPSSTGYFDLVAGYLRTAAVLTNVTADLDYIRYRGLRDA